jgi:hypothetical protein
MAKRLSQRLLARAQKLNKLVNKKTHPQVSVALQRAFAGLLSSEILLSEVMQAAESVVAESQKPKKRSAMSELAIGFRLKAINEELPELLQAAELMASGRDAEMYKLLGRRSLSVAMGIAAKLSGIGYVKDAVDILGGLEEIVDTGEAVKLRRDQVREASKLFRWADAKTLLTIAWCYSAEEMLFKLTAQGDGSDDAIIDRVVKQIAKQATAWALPIERAT